MSGTDTPAVFSFPSVEAAHWAGMTGRNSPYAWGSLHMSMMLNPPRRPDVVLVGGCVETNPRAETVYIDDNRFHLPFMMLYGILEEGQNWFQASIIKKDLRETQIYLIYSPVPPPTPPGWGPPALQIGASGSRSRDFLTGVGTMKPQGCCVCREDVVHTECWSYLSLFLGWLVFVEFWFEMVYRSFLLPLPNYCVSMTLLKNSNLDFL